MEHTASEVLRKARELIEEKGWIQNAPCDHRDRSCLTRAVAVVIRGQANECALLVEARRAITATIGTEEHALWNDNPSRTIEQVLSMLSRAADLAEKAEVQ